MGITQEKKPRKAIQRTGVDRGGTVDPGGAHVNLNRTPHTPASVTCCYLPAQAQPPGRAQPSPTWTLGSCQEAEWPLESNTPQAESPRCHPSESLNDSKLPGFLSSAKWVHLQQQQSLLVAIGFGKIMECTEHSQATLSVILFLPS